MPFTAINSSGFEAVVAATKVQTPWPLSNRGKQLTSPVVQIFRDTSASSRSQDPRPAAAHANYNDRQILLSTMMEAAKTL